MINGGELTTAHDFPLPNSIGTSNEIVKPANKLITRRTLFKLAAGGIIYEAAKKLGGESIDNIEDPADEFSAQLQQKLSSPFHPIINLEIDVNGRRKDCFKIAQFPNGSYGAISHSLDIDKRFVSSLWQSKDLKNWDYIADYEKNLVMPSMEISKDGVIFIGGEKNEGNIERSPNNSWTALAIYKDFNSLLAHKDLWHLKSEIVEKFTHNSLLHLILKSESGNEGTLSFNSIDYQDEKHWKIVIGLHYNQRNWFTDRGTDMNALATFENGNLISAETNNELNNPMLNNGISGAIGQREIMEINGKKYTFVEIQSINGNLRSFRIYIFDHQNERYFRLPLKTKSGSEAFANPRITKLILPNGKIGFAITYYLFEKDPTKSGPKLMIFEEDMLLNF